MPTDPFSESIEMLLEKSKSGNSGNPLPEVTIGIFDRNALTFGRDWFSSDTKIASNAISTLASLAKNPAWHGYISRQEAESRLASRPLEAPLVLIRSRDPRTYFLTVQILNIATERIKQALP